MNVQYIYLYEYLYIAIAYGVLHGDACVYCTTYISKLLF